MAENTWKQPSSRSGVDAIVLSLGCALERDLADGLSALAPKGFHTVRRDGPKSMPVAVLVR